MAVDHTAGVPPRCGSTILVKSGCTENSSTALRNSVPPKSATGTVLWPGRKAGIATAPAAGKLPSAGSIPDSC